MTEFVISKLEGGLRCVGAVERSFSRKPLISVITVTLNASEYLKQSMDSVFQQSYPAIEYIVIDGGSTDGTVALLCEQNSRLDYWRSEPDFGLYDAMNKGAVLASGDWVYFLGADDRLFNVFHEVAPSLVDQNTIYYGDVLRPALGRTYDGEFTTRKMVFSNICHQAIFYPRRVFQKYLYETRYRILADWALNMRLWADREFKFVHLPTTISFYDDSRGTSFGAHDPLFERDKWALVWEMVSPSEFLYYCARMGLYELKTRCGRMLNKREP